MQIGGYIMEAGATPEDILTSPDMGVIIKREQESPYTISTESANLDPPDPWNNLT